MGLLDDFSEFAKTPEGQGLLSAAFGGLAGARRNAGPLNTIGMAGLSGLNGYSSAQDQQQRLKSASLANTMTQMQVDQMKRQQDQQNYIDQAAQNAYKPAMTADQNAMAQVAKAGGPVGPTVQAASMAPTTAATPGGMDSQALISAIAAKYPMVALDMQQKAKQAGRVTLKKDDIVYDEATGKPIYSNPVPDLQYVPGTGYKPDLIFDKASGKIVSPGATGNGSPSMQPNPTGQPDMSGGGPPPNSPNAPRAPWAGMPPEQADQMRKSTYEAEDKKLQDLRDSVAKGRKTLSALERFGTLNQQSATGTIADKMLPDSMTFDPGKQEMVSIQSALAPTMRATGSGSSSDTDVRLMKSGLPSIDKTGDVNMAIRNNYKNQLNSDAQELAFKEKYLSQYGHLNGADQAYQQALQGGQGAPTQQQSAPVQVTPTAKMLNAQQRAALDLIIKDGNPQLLDSARKKGWIK